MGQARLKSALLSLMPGCVCVCVPRVGTDFRLPVRSVLEDAVEVDW